MLDSEIHVPLDVAVPAFPGLRYVSDDAPAIRRRQAGKGFVYLERRTFN
jgi:DNA topoisomerase IB